MQIDRDRADFIHREAIAYPVLEILDPTLRCFSKCMILFDFDSLAIPNRALMRVVPIKVR